MEDVREDTRLLSDASAGDPLAIDQLLHRNLPDLQAYIRLRNSRAVRLRESDSDIVQSVCREILQDLARSNRSFRDESQFRACLFREANDKVIERYRALHAKKRDVRLEVSGDPAPMEGGAGIIAQLAGPSTSPSGELMLRERMEAVEAAIAELPEDQREVFLMSRIMRLPHREIAAQLGKSESATRSLMKRANVRIAMSLHRSEGEED